MIKKFDLVDALTSLYPNASFVIRDGNYSTLEWMEDSEKPSKVELESEVIRLQQEYNNKEYQRLRAAEYPSIQEQMDMQYWDSVNGTTTWQDAINAVKAKYPKPEGV
jgi:hypothetical protein